MGQGETRLGTTLYLRCKGHPWHVHLGAAFYRLGAVQGTALRVLRVAQKR
jgi:hypothetical protein